MSYVNLSGFQAPEMSFNGHFSHCGYYLGGGFSKRFVVVTIRTVFFGKPQSGYYLDGVMNLKACFLTTAQGSFIKI